jgi:hypothetical protein
MKKLISSMFLIGIILTANSCKKSPADPVVEYQISPADNYITEMRYNGLSGTLTTVTDLSLFVDGKLDIAIPQKPFTAKFEATVNNTTAYQMPYSIVIYVDGQIKTYAQFTVPPHSINTSVLIDYTIN